MICFVGKYVLRSMIHIFLVPYPLSYQLLASVYYRCEIPPNPDSAASLLRSIALHFRYRSRASIEKRGKLEAGDVMTLQRITRAAQEMPANIQALLNLVRRQGRGRARKRFESRNCCGPSARTTNSMVSLIWDAWCWQALIVMHRCTPTRLSLRLCCTILSVTH